MGGRRAGGCAAVSGEVAFGCEISEDRKRCAIVAAGRDVARLAELEAKHDPVSIVVDGMSQAATLLRPLADAGVMVTAPKPRDVAVAHGEFLDLVNDGGLAHLDQPPLTAAVRAAQQRPLSGAQAWERKVPVDQAPLVAATLAVWAFLAWEVLSQPGAVVI